MASLTNLIELKAEAYVMATKKDIYDRYNYAAEDRARAMLAYAFLTIAETFCNKDKE